MLAADDAPFIAVPLALQLECKYGAPLGGDKEKINLAKLSRELLTVGKDITLAIDPMPERLGDPSMKGKVLASIDRSPSALALAVRDWRASFGDGEQPPKLDQVKFNVPAVQGPAGLTCFLLLGTKLANASKLTQSALTRARSRARCSPTSTARICTTT